MQYLQKTWVNAQLDCKKKKMSLVTIPNEEEQQRIVDIIEPLNENQPDWWWNGGHNGVWIVNYQKFNYTNFKEGEPNSDDPKNINFNQEHCVAMAAPSWEWIDMLCPTSQYYLCRENLPIDVTSNINYKKQPDELPTQSSKETSTTSLYETRNVSSNESLKKLIDDLPSLPPITMEEIIRKSPDRIKVPRRSLKMDL